MRWWEVILNPRPGPLLYLPSNTKTVISTEAAHRFIVSSSVEKSASLPIPADASAVAFAVAFAVAAAVAFAFAIAVAVAVAVAF
jgi:hypothetical protein